MRFYFPKKLILFAFFGCFLLCFCSRSKNYKWARAIPNKSAFVIIPAEGTSLQSAVKSKYISTFEQFSSPALQQIIQIDSAASGPLPLKGIDLFAGTHQILQVLWLFKAPEDFKDTLLQKFAPAFEENHYRFHHHKILILHINNQAVFAARLHNLFLISTASRVIEQSILAFSRKKNRINLKGLTISPGSVIMNTPEVDKWLARIGKVKQQSHISNILNGASPVLLKLKSKKAKNLIYSLSGQVGLHSKKESLLVKAASYANKPLFLDQYISADAAGFAVLRAPPAPFPKKLPDTTAADFYLMKHNKVYKKLASTLDVEFGLEMFANSGFQSTSEHLYLRKLKNVDGFQDQLASLGQDSIITKVDSTTYFAQSNALAGLLGSRLCDFKNFYVSTVGDAAVIAARKGLIDKVDFNHSQRQTIQYEGYYRQMKATFPPKISSLLVAGPKFRTFMQPLVSNQQYSKQLFSKFKYLALTTHLDSTKNQLTLHIASFNGQQPKRSFQENWIYEMSGASISGHPVFGNIGGSPNKEVVFATKKGKVIVLATDGTLVHRFNTNQDVPVGSPVVYNWFGTGHNVILVAAGNKIYGWSIDGDPLPGFPLSFKYKITSPLVVADVNHDQTPDVVVATENRKLHIINAHGKHLAGWPVKTNVPIRTAPYVGYFQGQEAVAAFSGNTINAWNIHGRSMPGFPAFASASLHGRPVKFRKALLGNASDGRLYAAGDSLPFADSLNVLAHSISTSPELMALNISSHALTGTPSIFKNKILTASRTGDIYLLSDSGHLLQTESAGAPLSENWSPEMIDINAHGSPDLLALTQNGRLYGWRPGSGKKLKNLPKTTMSHIHIGDLKGDGLMEIVGLTSKGLECWTVYPAQ
jgi:hypothetical protein